MHFLAFVGACGILMILFGRTRRLGKLLLGALVAGYLVLSVPHIAHAIAGPDTDLRAAAAATYGALDDIFVIDGDNYDARAAFTATLVQTAKPKTVWVVGGGELRDAIVAHGIRSQLWRWAGGSSRTTYEQIKWIQQWLSQEKHGRVAIIASRLHAPRILGLVRSQQIDAIVIPSPLDSEPATTGVAAWLPSFSGLSLSREGLYERVAMAYYRHKGWL